jgi:hypothetical protein
MRFLSSNPFPTSMYISKFTSPNKAIGTTFFMQLGHTFRHQVNQKKREEVQSSSFRRRGIEAMIFSRRLAPLLKRLFITHGTCIPIF